MTEHITLPRSVVEQAQLALNYAACNWVGAKASQPIRDARDSLTESVDAALAAPQGEPETHDYVQEVGSKNCMQCAVAYMLGLPLLKTPDFEKIHSPQCTAYESMEAFFNSQGYTAEMLPPNMQISGDYLASGSTKRGTSHMVVMRNGELLHDPHPSKDGLESVQVIWVIARRCGATWQNTTTQPAPQAEPVQHWSDCAVNNGPALPVGPCDCGGYTAPPPAQPVAAPHGYKLVPVEPTHEMRDAGCPAGEFVDHFDIATAYRAMLNAAPTPPAATVPVPVLEPLTQAERGRLILATGYKCEGLSQDEWAEEIIFAVEAAHAAKLAKLNGITPPAEGGV